MKKILIIFFLLANSSNTNGDDEIAIIQSMKNPSNIIMQKANEKISNEIARYRQAISIVQKPPLMWDNQEKFIQGLEEKLEFFANAVIQEDGTYKSFTNQGEEITFEILKSPVFYVDTLNGANDIKLKNEIATKLANIIKKLEETLVQEVDFIKSNLWDPAVYPNPARKNGLIKSHEEIESWKSARITEDDNSVIQLTKAYEPKTKYKFYEGFFYRQKDAETTTKHPFGFYTIFGSLITRVKINLKLLDEVQNFIDEEVEAQQEFDDCYHRVITFMNFLCGEDFEILWTHFTSPFELGRAQDILLFYNGETLTTRKILDEHASMIEKYKIMLES